ncbi:putative leucine-rich repeat domain superfamily [Helianthus annuus]|nr:putative leucine-rich repeat domain superfamily [Helianthus annuus]KAJ0651094.1 putative leucine-rich repeat domain superfamily [Helianthus annuus]KAJ0829673.1 putative leucine-rich repeat domain superfamily [Helianthus annuus]
MVSPLRSVNSEKGGHEEVHDWFGYRREIVDKGEKDKNKDIVDLLPSDPFGMDFDISITFTAITGWFGDLELEYGDRMRNKVVNHTEDYRLFAGFNFFWNSTMKFQLFPTNLMYHDQHTKGFDRVSESVVVTKCGESVNEFAVCPDVIGGDPHDAFPLNERITDDILVRLTNLAEGNLRFLSLIKCPKITDDGLRRVLETNPKSTKLFIPGCTRLGIETAGIKHIRTGGFYGITLDHYEQLNNLLGVQNNKHIPHYYHRANLHVPCDNDRALDVEICPRCQNLRLVYDCPAGGCRPKDECRACIICIPRCAECGRCVHNSEYEETFSLEYLSSECLKQLLRCQEPHG